MKRIIHALAALAMVAVTTLAWAQPAQAAPGGSCSVEEWEWGNFADCAKRLGRSVQETTGCVTAPTPASPTEGMAGWFTIRPDSSLRDGIQGMYSTYGNGGGSLSTYDMGCLAALNFPVEKSSSMIANAEFQAASSILAAANGSRELAYTPAKAWSWSDGFLESATAAIYKYVFNPIGGLTLAVAGVFLMVRAQRGQMKEAVNVTLWAVFVIVAVTGLVKWPVASAHVADAVAYKGLTIVHNVLGPGPQNTPPQLCDEAGLNPQACMDNRSVATRSADVVTEAIFYQSWLRAVLGDSDSDTAKKYGKALFDATSLSWGEADRAAQSPQLRTQLIEQKAATFKSIAAQIQADDPIAYEHLQGMHPGDRIGAGLIAMLSAGAFSMFDVTSSIVILFAFGIFRAAVLFFPLLGTIGIFYYASSGLRRVMHAVSAAVMNVFVFGAYEGLYLLAVDAIFRADIPGFVRLIVVALTGFIGLLLAHPIRRFMHTATGRSRSHPSVFDRMFGAAKTLRAEQGQPIELDDDAEPGPDAVRPENRARARRGTGQILAAAAPSLAALPNNEGIRNALTAANGVSDAAADASARPETGERLGRTKYFAGAAATAVASAYGGPAAGAAANAATTAVRNGTARPAVKPTPTARPETTPTPARRQPSPRPRR